MAIALGSPDLYTVGWIAALPIERSAAIAMLDERHDAPNGFEQHSSDHNLYSWGHIGNHNIVIASLPAGICGQNAAAGTVSQLLSSLPGIRIGLLVGIGGAIPNHGPVGMKYDIRLGDIVVGQPSGPEGGVIQYDMGKMGTGEWERIGTVDKPPRVLLNALSNLQAEHMISPSRVPELLAEMIARYPLMAESMDKSTGFIHPGISNDQLFVSDYKHVGGGGDDPCSRCDSSQQVHRDDRHTTDPAIHYGTIASGNTLVKDARFRDGIAGKAGQQCICFEMEAAGINRDFPCLIIRGICDYSDSHKNDQWQKYASATSAAYAKELLGFVPVKSVNTTPRAIDAMKSIDVLQQNVQSLRNIVLDPDLKESLALLPIASEASFDSHDESGNPVCLEGTRVELLNEIMQWAEAQDPESVFWLNGMAGTGKSTICRSIAHRLGDAGLLGASFFFKRGEGDRGVSAKLFTTLASQLATRIPDLATYIKRAIDSDIAVGTKSLPEQFNRLIYKPLSEFLHSDSTAIRPIVILIDALDECELGDSAINKSKLMMSLLSRAKELPGLRVFVTSRPELPDQIGFDAVRGTYQDMILRDISRLQIQQDISRFFEHEFERIRSQHRCSLAEELPSPSEVDRLANMSIPLFIVAVTICRFFNEHKHGSPKEKLQGILQSPAEGCNSGLGMTYMSILSKLIQGLREAEKATVLQQFRHIVGSILVLMMPLTIHGLSRILRLRQDVVDEHLSMLHSVLNIPSNPRLPVRLLHLSFRDFLVNTDEEAGLFAVREQDSHARMAIQCLQLLSVGSSLRRDICDLENPGTKRCNISQQLINASLPPEIQYASRYWAYHWKESGHKIRDGDPVHQFLETHFLHWIEALAILAQARDSIRMFEDLLDLVDDGDMSVNISKSLYDARRFILQNSEVIQNWPLQIYHTALVFAPQNSYIRNHFQHEFPIWLTELPQVQRHWSAQLQVLEHNDWESRADQVNCLSFSPDSSTLAYGTELGTINVWNPRTGESTATQEGHGCQVNSVIFLPDPRVGQLASASNDGTIKIWEIATGECITTLGGGNSWVESIVYSPEPRPLLAAADSTSIAIWDLETKECTAMLKHDDDDDYDDDDDLSRDLTSIAVIGDSGFLLSAGLSDSFLKVWDMASNSCIETLKGHDGGILSVAVSPDSSMIASASWDCTIILWNAARRSRMVTLKDDCDRPSLTFLRDSMLASASRDGTVKIWDTSKRTILATLMIDRNIAYPNPYASVSPSPDANLLASAFENGIYLWDVALMASRERATPSHAPSRQATAHAFSQDFEMLVSGLKDGNIEVWNTTSGELKQTLVGHSDEILDVAIWPDATRIASASVDMTIRLWDTKTGKCIKIVRGHEVIFDRLALSPDLMILASSSLSDEVVTLWDVGTAVSRKHSFSPRVYRSWRASREDGYIATRETVDNIAYVAFSPTSAALAISSSRDLTIWNWETWTRLHIIEAGRRASSISFLPNARILFSGPANKLQLWDLATGACLATIDIDHRLYRLDLDETGSSLHNDRGLLTFQQPILSPSVPTENILPQAVRIGIGLSADDAWITWNSHQVLWLPPMYRPNKYQLSTSVIGSRIIIGVERETPFISMTVDEIAISRLKLQPQ